MELACLLPLPTTSRTKCLAYSSPENYIRVICNIISSLPMSTFSTSHSLTVEDILLRWSCKRSPCFLRQILWSRSSSNITPITVPVNNDEHRQSSLSSATFPDQFKHSVTKPLLTKSNLDRESLSGYRPISNLPFISQLTERLVKAQLTEHWDKSYQLFFQLSPVCLYEAPFHSLNCFAPNPWSPC